MFARPALVYGQKKVFVKNFFYFGTKTLVCFASSITLIGAHHSSELFIAHRVYTAVSKHVKIQIIRCQTVRIKSRFAYRLYPVLNGQQISFLNNANLMHFQREAFSCVVLYLCHYYLLK